MIANAISVPGWAIARLMPMHAIVAPTGHFRQVGPTLKKLIAPGMLRRRFLEVFEVRRPRSVSWTSELMDENGTRLNLRLRDFPEIPMRGIAVPLGKGQGLFVNLSFGITATDAARIFNLTSGDFAPTDLNIDMMYLVEAKTAIEAESRRQNSRLEGAKSEAEERASTDALTGLKNRRAMDGILERYKTGGEKFTLIHLDLDFFKEVNDTHGHAAGDYVLKEAAKILKEEVRAEDSVIRAGGDEFVLLIHRVTDPIHLRKIGDRILNRLTRAMVYEGNICKISGSMGITMSDDYAQIDPEQMMVDADFSLYAAKKAGRAQFCFVREVGGVGRSVVDLGAS